MRKLLVVAIALLAAFPLARSSGGGAFTDDRTYGGAVVPYVAGDDVEYRGTLAAGDHLRVTLSWADPTADLQLFVITPALDCKDLASCATDTSYFSCRDDATTPAPGSGATSRVLDLDAIDAGSYTVEVTAGASPLPTAMHIEIAVNGDAGADTWAFRGQGGVTVAGQSELCALP